MRLLTRLFTLSPPFLCRGALQGSTIADSLTDIDFVSSIINGLLKAASGLISIIPKLYDIRLGHWGLRIRDNDTMKSFLERIFKSRWAFMKSNALYDLRVDCK